MFFLSAIVPVFNRKKCICRCLDTILKQSFKDFELIVVDDGSDDGTGEICDSYAEKSSKVKVIHQQNRGVSGARNAGLKKAKGQFCIFIDSDDGIPSNYFQNIKKAYDKFGAGFIYVMTYRIYTEGRIEYMQYKKKSIYSAGSSNDIFQLVNKGLFNAVNNKVYQVKFIKEHRIVFPEGMDLGEDLVFNLRYLDKLENFNFVVLNKNYYFYYGYRQRDSLEHRWREDYFEIQQRLLREKIKYIEKWIYEGRISKREGKIFSRWYSEIISEAVNYYVRNAKKMGIIQMLKKMDKIKHSPEYLRYMQINGKGKLYKIIWHSIFCFKITDQTRFHVSTYNRIQKRGGGK